MVVRHATVAAWLLAGLALLGCLHGTATPITSEPSPTVRLVTIPVRRPVPPTRPPAAPGPTADPSTTLRASRRPFDRAQDRQPTAAPTPTATPSPTSIPTTPTIEQADVLRRNGDYAGAIAAYRALLALGPLPAEARILRRRLGETLLLDDNPALAAQVLSAYLEEAPDDASAWFLLGRARESLQDWVGAIVAYDAYRERDDTLADHAGLRIAAALRELGRLDEAAAEYRTVNAITPDDELATRALEGLAELALAREDAAEAAAWYIQAANRATDAARQARLLGLAGTAYLAAGQKDAAAGVLRQVVGDHPETGAAYSALADLRLLGYVVDLRLRGLVYYHNGDYRAAVGALTAYLATDPEPLGDAYYFLGRSYEGLGRWSAAVAVYGRLIQEYPDNERFGAAWVRKARALRALGDPAGALATYREFANRYPTDPLADNALWEAARALEAIRRRDEAAQLYREITVHYPRGDVGQQAAFRVGLVPYLEGDYAEARAAWRAAAARTATAEARAQVLLWAAKGALALGETRAAQADLDAAARAAPLSFDGLRAREMGGRPPPTRTPPPDTQRWLGLDRATWMAINRRLQHDRRYQRGQALLAVGLRAEGLAELKALRNAYRGLPAHLACLAALLDDPTTRHLSIAAAERALILTGTSPLEAPPELARLAYPADYADLVRIQAQRYAIDPRLLLALIRQESRFNPTATSYADARGLTQVIPSTARHIARRLGIRGFAAESLYRPYRSVEFGASYLAEQLGRFDGDVLAALAAYNGGPGNARRWRSLTDDPDMFVASIHLDQTRNFVRWVMEQYAVYRGLYGEDLEGAR